MRRQRANGASQAKKVAHKRYLALVLLVLLAGCSPALQYAPTPPPPAPSQGVRPEYRLRPGDAIQLQFYYQPELQSTQVIRPDGKIYLLLLGELKVSGMTPSELRQKLTEEYKKYFDRFDVMVIVNKTAGKAVYVSGAVPVNKIVEYEGDLTVTQAIISCGGFSSSARLDSVLVIRDQGTSVPKVYKIDVKDALRKGGRDFLLQHRDVVYVPVTKITKVNQFVSQYIDGIIPKHVATVFSFSYPLKGVSSDVNININPQE